MIFELWPLLEQLTEATQPRAAYRNQRRRRKCDMMHSQFPRISFATIVSLIAITAVGCHFPPGRSGFGFRPQQTFVPPGTTVRRVPSQPGGTGTVTQKPLPEPRKTVPSTPSKKTGPQFPGGTVTTVKLSLLVTAPLKVQLGSPVTFDAVVRNDGSAPVRAASVQVRFDDGLQFPGHGEKIVNRPIDNLAPGKSVTISFSLTATQLGSSCAEFSMKLDGRETVWKKVCVEVVPRQFAVNVAFAPLRTVGGSSEFTVSVENVSKQELRGVTVEVRFDPRLLKPRDGTRGARVGKGVLTWNVNRLRPGVSVHLQAEMACLAATKQACLQVSVISADVPEDRRIVCSGIIETGKPFDMRMADTNDVIRVGDETDIVISVRNRSGKRGSLPELEVTIPDGFEVRSTSVWEGRQPLVTKATVTPGTLSFPSIPMVAIDASITYRIRVKAKNPGHTQFSAKIKLDEQTTLELHEPVTVIR